MFGSPIYSPSAASLSSHTTTHVATPAPTIAPTTTTTTIATARTPTSPTRASRLRGGLSYLRSYTHNHLHSHSSTSPTRAGPGSIVSPTSSTGVGSSGPGFGPHSRLHSRGAPALTRSASVPGTTRNLSSAIEQAPISSPSPRRGNTTVGDSPTDAWLPTVGGQSGLSRVAPQPQPACMESSTAEPATISRTRAATASEQAHNRTEDMMAMANTAAPREKKESMPSIRFIPHHEPRSSRPSLSFPIITRTLPTNDTRVKVGRYSERDNNAADALSNPLSTAPVGFKSKVVSRKHCELWFENGQWFIKDVKSSSGTFLNHVRLSSPGHESRAYPVRDGDIVQLGIDFKGGEEVIYRCVKIRVECNRGWQKSVNQFNTATHKRLLGRSKAAGNSSKDSDTQSTHSSECSICLNPVAPCQALFVAPCSHVWHFKCIRQLIFERFPSFQCPNCRAYSDLEADVEPAEDEDEGDWMDEDMDDAIRQSQGQSGALQSATRADDAAARTTIADLGGNADDDDITEMLSSVSMHDADHDDLFSTALPVIASDSEAEAEGEAEPGARPRSHGQASTSSASTTHNNDTRPHMAAAASLPVPILAPASRASQANTDTHNNNNNLPESIMARSATPTSTTQFALAAGLLSPEGGTGTPMNDVGPFVFDGASGRRDGSGEVRQGEQQQQQQQQQNHLLARQVVHEENENES